VASAGLNRDSGAPVTRDLLEWADRVYVMESAHRARLQRRFGTLLKGKDLKCLGISDKYQYMDPALVRLLERKLRKT
jgi:predicted protein tyrosine phosphatase